MANNNIIGEEFEDYVQKQIGVRQKIHGSGTPNNPRSVEYLSYLNSKTAWVKLASGVSISEERLKKEGMDASFQGMDLAKKRVLFGGVASLEGDKLIQRGTNKDRSLNITDPNSGTYNVNQKNEIDDLEFGLVPMPGITSVDIKNKNRGSIKEATVKITAYTREQFDFIDLLYMRLGYTVFLEWGWSTYFDNKGDYQEMNYTLIEEPNGFFNDAWGQSENDGPNQKNFRGFLGKITEHRIKTKGNADGLLAKVRNFDWTISSDGTYDITLSLISVGDVIESLKINLTPTKTTLDLLNRINRGSDSLNSSTGQAVEIINSNPDTPSNLISTTNSLLSYLSLFKLTDQSPIDALSTAILWNGISSITLNSSGWANEEGGSGLYHTSELPDGRTIKYLNTGRYVTLKDEIKILLNEWYQFSTGEEGEKKANKKFKELYDAYTPEIISGEIKLHAYTSGWLTTSNSWEGTDGSKPDFSSFTLFGEGSLNITIKGTSTQSDTLSGLNQPQTTPKDVFVMNYISEDESPSFDSSYYMKLGYLLRFIKYNLIPLESKTRERIINIHTSLGESNRMYKFPFQHSHDPKVCLVRSSFPNGIGDDGEITYFNILPQLPAWFEKGKDYAYLMNIYVNFQQIESSVNDNLDEEGNLSLFDFLSSLCTAINKALGGVNNLEPVIDEETNTLKIIDGSYTPDESPVNDYSLELYGYNNTNNTSNFVRNFSIKSTVSKEYASMISIGATAAGYTKGMEATMFSKWNHGVVDRFKEEYIQPDPSTNPLPTSSLNEVVTNYIENVLLKPPSTNRSNPEGGGYFIDSGRLNSQLSFSTEFYKYCQSQFHAKNPKYGSPTIGFIPISLNLSLDGMSGMKIYNVVRANTSFLPKNYTDSLRFITTSVNHKLSNNDWETSIDTMVIPENYDKEGDKIILPYAERLEEVKRILQNNIDVRYSLNPKTSTRSGGSVTARANSAGISQLNSEPSISNTPLLKKAVSDQSIYMFTKVRYNGGAPGERTGVCAGYTFNIALNLKEHIDKESSQAIPITYTASGNANSDAHRKAIDLLGFYKRINLGSFTAEELKSPNSIINTTKWNYGDILNYYSPGNSGGSNMHSQIYTGDIWQKSTYISKGKIITRGNSGWSTSVSTNYGGTFIYSSSSKVFKVFAFKVKDGYLK